MRSRDASQIISPIRTDHGHNKSQKLCCTCEHSPVQSMVQETTSLARIQHYYSRAQQGSNAQRSDYAPSLRRHLFNVGTEAGGRKLLDGGQAMHSWFKQSSRLWSIIPCRMAERYALQTSTSRCGHKCKALPASERARSGLKTDSIRKTAANNERNSRAARWEVHWLPSEPWPWDAAPLQA